MKIWWLQGWKLVRRHWQSGQMSILILQFHIWLLVDSWRRKFYFTTFDVGHIVDSKRIREVQCPQVEQAIECLWISPLWGGVWFKQPLWEVFGYVFLIISRNWCWWGYSWCGRRSCRIECCWAFFKDIEEILWTKTKWCPIIHQEDSRTPEEVSSHHWEARHTTIDSFFWLVSLEEFRQVTII